MRFTTGDLVRIISPNSLKEMDIVGIVIDMKYPSDSWFQVWIPDINKEMYFDKNQMEKVP